MGVIIWLNWDFEIFLHVVPVKATGGGGPRIFSAKIFLFEIIVAFDIPLETSGQRTREKRNLRRDGLKRVGAVFAFMSIKQAVYYKYIYIYRRKW